MTVKNGQGPERREYMDKQEKRRRWKRGISALLAGVLACSLFGVAGAEAFGAVAEPAGGPLVYDEVYGVFGGKYALMSKETVYSAQYQGKVKEYVLVSRDIVRADGKKTFQSAYTEGDDGVHTKDTQLQYGYMFGNGSYGIYISDKDSGLAGALSMDGNTIVPCRYKDIALDESTHRYYATRMVNGATQIDVYDGKTAKKHQTITVARGQARSVSVMPGLLEVGVQVSSDEDVICYYFDLSSGSVKKLEGVERAACNHERAVSVFAKGDGSLWCVTASISPRQIASDVDPSQYVYIDYEDGMVHYTTKKGLSAQKSLEGYGSGNVEGAESSGKEIFFNGIEVVVEFNYDEASGLTYGSVTDPAGKRITRNGYTLAIPPHRGLSAYGNSVRHRNLDVWFAADGKGKYGAIDSKGNVVVPFRYDSYYDHNGISLGGAKVADTNYALVKRNGGWWFYDVVNRREVTPATSTATPAPAPTKPRQTSLASAKVIVKSKVYSGKTQKPKSITVKMGGKTLKAGVDYAFNCKGGKKIGTYTVTVVGKGAYAGTVKGKFQIVPKGVTAKKPAAGKKSFTAKWKKPSKSAARQITGFKVQYSTDKKFKKAVKTKTVRNVKKTSLKVSKLKAKKTYYVRLCTYKKVGGKQICSSWSKVQKVKTKK